MNINTLKETADINSDKVKQDEINLPRYNVTCRYCIIQSLYKEKHKGKTSELSFLKDLVTNEMLMHRDRITCIDCPKIECMMFSGNINK